MILKIKANNNVYYKINIDIIRKENYNDIVIKIFTYST